MWPQCSQAVPGGEEGAVCPGAKEPTGPSQAICVSTSLPFWLEILPNERQDIKVPCAHPGWLSGSSSLPAAAPTLTHSVRVSFKFFGDLSPITQLSNQNICIFMSMYDKSFRTPQVTNSYYSENELLEIKQLLLQIK